MPPKTPRILFVLATAIIAILQAVACTAVESIWGNPEITGGTAEQRVVLRDRVAKALVNAAAVDRDLMVEICNGVRRDVSQKATCGLVVEKFSGRHYLVELPPRNLASRRDAADFIDPIALGADDLRMASVLEDRFGGALLAATAIDVSLRDALPDVAGLDQEVVADATRRAKRLGGELPRMVRSASREDVRRGAAMLLGWSADPEASLAALEPAMSDPDEDVRNVGSMNAAMLAPDASAATQQRWSGLWCREMASGSYTDRTKALLGLARLSRRGIHVTDEHCVLNVRSYANETSMPSLKALAHDIAEQ
jgi:hypothetical protein